MCFFLYKVNALVFLFVNQPKTKSTSKTLNLNLASFRRLTTVIDLYFSLQQPNPTSNNEYSSFMYAHLSVYVSNHVQSYYQINPNM